MTASLIRAAPNYVSDPPLPAWDGDTVIYHALPHGLRGPLRERIRAELYVDITTTLARKRDLLAEHRSQQEWLSTTQAMASMVTEMETFSATIGTMSGGFAHAEGFRRHLHFGFAPEQADPLRDALGENAWFDAEYSA